MIIVGVDDSAEAEAAARWGVHQADLPRDDLLLVHAYDVPTLGPKRREAPFTCTTCRLSGQAP
jgi:hypothetical protein